MPGTILAANTHFNDAGTERIGLDGTNITIATSGRLVTNGDIQLVRDTQYIRDSSGNELVELAKQAAAVNQMILANAPTGNYPAIVAKGDDAAVGIYIKAQGAGEIQLAGGDGIVQVSVGNSNTEITRTFSITGSISPSLTASQNDYNPTGLSGATWLRLSTSADGWAITGISGGYDGRILYLVNTSTLYYIWLQAENVSSTAANRLALNSSDGYIDPGMTYALIYDGTSQRWRPLHPTYAWSGAGGMEAATSYYYFVPPVFAHRAPSAAKVWVVGTPNSTTIITSYNVTSLGDTATGQQTVTIANDFSSANYCVIIGVDDTSSTVINGTAVSSRAVGSYIMNSVIEAGGLDDPLTAWHSVAFGDQ